MKLLNLKITGILLSGFLFLGASSAQALVSLEHYEKMKKENKQKAKEPKTVQQQALSKIQVHQSSQGQALVDTPAGKAGQK